MEVALKTVNSPEKLSTSPTIPDKVVVVPPAEGPPKGPMVSPPGQQQQRQQEKQPQQQQQQHPQQKTKRKHRRGKPKAKNANKPYKKNNWRFQMPRLNYSKGSGSTLSGGNVPCNRRQKLQRSRSLVPYNTNKFLMEEHLAEVPSALLTPTGRTRDSSFSMDSEDNYFFSLPEDEEEFLTKEFANVYEKARVERLESLSKQELIEECLQIEDRYSKDQGNQRQQQLNIQRIAQEYMGKIRLLDEKVKELSRENHNLRCQLMRSAAFAAAAAASPPSAAAPMGAACQPTPMDSSSEDSESDSSTSSSSSSSSNNEGRAQQQQQRRRRSCSSHSSLSEYNGYIENNYMHNNLAAEERRQAAGVINNQRALIRPEDEDYERRQLLDDHMDDDDEDDDEDVEGDDEYEENTPKLNGFHNEQQLQQQQESNIQISSSVNTRPPPLMEEQNNAGIQENVNSTNVGGVNNVVEVVEPLQNPLN